MSDPLSQSLLPAIDAILAAGAAADEQEHVALGLLEQAGWLKGREGSGLVIGIDMGGTKLLGAVAAASGEVLAERELPTLGASAPEQVIELVGALLGQIGADRRRLAQVAIGVPGAVDATGAVGISPHLAFPPGQPFAPTLARLLGVPVVADNDANMAALGEYASRAPAGPGVLVLVTLGTGIGMGLVINGQVLRGAHGAAGEIGSMPFSGPVPLADVGIYEGEVASSALLARYQASGGRLANVRAIFDAADRGDSAAAAAIDRYLDDVAQGLATVVALLDPGLIVLGGGIGSRAGIAGRVAERLGRLVPVPCDVVSSQLGPRAGLVGALALGAREARAALARKGETEREVAA